MIDPIRPDDCLYPMEQVEIDGRLISRRRSDWTAEKQVALRIRSIEYFLQFEEKHATPSVINMIEACAPTAAEHGTEAQKLRFEEFIALRETWRGKQNSSVVG